jgi:hypothetical protein
VSLLVKLPEDSGGQIGNDQKFGEGDGFATLQRTAQLPKESFRMI